MKLAAILALALALGCAAPKPALDRPRPCLCEGGPEKCKGGPHACCGVDDCRCPTPTVKASAR